MIAWAAGAWAVGAWAVSPWASGAWGDVWADGAWQSDAWAEDPPAYTVPGWVTGSWADGTWASGSWGDSGGVSGDFDGVTLGEIAGQDVGGTLVQYYDAATLGTITGQVTAWSLTINVEPVTLGGIVGQDVDGLEVVPPGGFVGADLAQIFGQDLGLSVVFNIEPAILGGIEGQDVTLQGGEPAPVPVASETGGWSALFRTEQARFKREEERELAKLLKQRLRAEDDRRKVEEVVALEVDEDASELERLRSLVTTYAATADRDLWANRTARAIDYAQRAQTALAYELALREIAKQEEELEMVLLMALASVA